MLDSYFVARVRDNDNKNPVNQRFQGGRGGVRMMGVGMVVGVFIWTRRGVLLSSELVRIV